MADGNDLAEVGKDKNADTETQKGNNVPQADGKPAAPIFLPQNGEDGAAAGDDEELHEHNGFAGNVGIAAAADDEHVGGEGDAADNGKKDA